MKRMTVVFEDDELYTAVKVEAARRNRPLKDLVTEILQEWLEAQEDAELLPLIDAALAEWKEKGGIEAGEFFRQLREEEAAKSRAVPRGDVARGGQGTQAPPISGAVQD